jgi:hypothetical protein
MRRSRDGARVAIGHAKRVRSLICVMSSTGSPTLPLPSPEMRARLVESADSTDALIELNAENRAVFGSPGYPESRTERMAAARNALRGAFDLPASRDRCAR